MDAIEKLLAEAEQLAADCEKATSNRRGNAMGAIYLRRLIAVCRELREGLKEECACDLDGISTCDACERLQKVARIAEGKGREDG